MNKKQWEVWEIVIETVTVMAVIAFLGLQIYYRYLYETKWVTIFYHILPIACIYVGMLMLQRFPEWLNGRNSEPLKGMVRIYAIRMIRSSKFLLVLGMLCPSVADALGIQMNPAYSLLIMAGILLVIGYYLYRIYQYNSSNKENR